MRLVKKSIKATAVMVGKDGSRTYATMKMQPDSRVVIFEGKEYAWTGERNASGYIVMKEVA